MTWTTAADRAHAWRGLRPGDFWWPQAARGEAGRALRSVVLNTLDDPSGGKTEHLLEALSALQRLEEEIPPLRRSLVAQARAAGVSWASIGRCFRVGRTAAQKRYANLDAGVEHATSMEELEIAATAAARVLAERPQHTSSEITAASEVLNRHRHWLREQKVEREQITRPTTN